MRNSLIALVTVPWLLMATVSLAQGSSGTSKQSINYVEVIQLNSQTQAFKAQLVDLRTKKVLIDVVGKGTQLQDFQKQSAKIAPRDQTVSLMGPGDPITSDVGGSVPRPPGPRGDDLLQLANQVAKGYEAILPAQVQINPTAVPPAKLKALPPAAQPSTAPVAPAVRQ
jgi:hypothetical protein